LAVALETPARFLPSPDPTVLRAEILKLRSRD
jgi:hypothetical protein